MCRPLPPSNQPLNVVAKCQVSLIEMLETSSVSELKSFLGFGIIV